LEEGGKSNYIILPSEKRGTRGSDLEKSVQEVHKKITETEKKTSPKKYAEVLERETDQKTGVGAY